MRLGLLMLVVGCSYKPSPATGDDNPGGDDAGGDDAAVYMLPTPMLIPGGGVGGGQIVAGLNIIVIDNETNLPIGGAAVTVGGMQGITDPSGLFVAPASLSGKQTVVATKTGYRAEQWIGVDGANVTIPLQPPTSPSANASGVVGGFASLNIAAGTNHSKRTHVGYSQDDRATTESNNLSSGGTNTCSGTNVCSFTVTARAGTVTLMGAIVDYDNKNTGTTLDDTESVIGWGFRSGVVIVPGVDVTGQDLAQITAANLNTVTIDYGTLPTGMTLPGGFLAIESGTDVIPLPLEAGTSLLVPKLSVFAGSTYRLTGFAISQDFTSFSTVIRRGSTSTALAAGTWLDAPQNASATATVTSFNVVPTATIYRVTYQDRTSRADVVESVIFDGTPSALVPAGITVPASLRVTVEAIHTTLDVADFGFDADAATIDAVSFHTVDVN